MAQFVVDKAALVCDKGAFGMLSVSPSKVKGCCSAIANEGDTNATMVGWCTAMNKPCTYAPGSWDGTSSKVNVRGAAAVKSDGSLSCSAGGGKLKVVFPGQIQDSVG